MRLFGRSSSTAPGIIKYVPRQHEPAEYTRYTAELMKWYQDATPFGFPVLVVGFEDPRLTAKVASGSAKVSLAGVLKTSPTFEARNPVLRIEYPALASASALLTGRVPSRDAGSALVSDARALKRLGATDLSAVGVSMAEAEALRQIFDEACCPFIAVVRA
jgi:hypothetical protein